MTVTTGWPTLLAVGLWLLVVPIPPASAQPASMGAGSLAGGSGAFE